MLALQGAHGCPAVRRPQMAVREDFATYFTKSSGPGLKQQPLIHTVFLGAVKIQVKQPITVRAGNVCGLSCCEWPREAIALPNPLKSLSQVVRKDAGQGTSGELAGLGVGFLETEAVGGRGRGEDSPHSEPRNWAEI